MSNTVVAQCTHVKTNGEVCGSPAVSGAAICYHHSAVKTALATGQPNGRIPDEGFAPMPFVFPEDRASVQINFFLLLQAYNEQRIDQRTYNSMLSLLKAMAKNLGKTGSLVEASDEAVKDETASGEAVSQRPVSDETAGGEADGEQGTTNEYPFEFSPELMAKLEEIESLSPNDPSRAERICAAVAEGANELRAQGLGLLEISPVAGSPTR